MAPTGRRAGLIGGPDVWEVAMWIDDLGDDMNPTETLATDGIVARHQIDAALGYCSDYSEEVNALFVQGELGGTGRLVAAIQTVSRPDFAEGC